MKRKEAIAVVCAHEIAGHREWPKRGMWENVWRILNHRNEKYKRKHFYPLERRKWFSWTANRWAGEIPMRWNMICLACETERGYWIGQQWRIELRLIDRFSIDLGPQHRSPAINLMPFFIRNETKFLSCRKHSQKHKRCHWIVMCVNLHWKSL